MHFVGRQAAQFLCHGLVGQGLGLFQGHPFGYFANHAGYRNGCATAERLELNIGQSVIIHFYVEGHHIPTGGVAYLPNPIRFLYLSHVAGIHKVVHDFICIRCHWSLSL